MESIGYILVFYGVASLLMNELLVDLRRAIKPWWRDSDPVGDDFLSEIHRLAIHFSSPLVIELGLYWSGLETLSVTTRLLIYTACSIEFVYRRRRFWEKVIYRERHRAYWNTIWPSNQGGEKELP